MSCYGAEQSRFELLKGPLSFALSCKLVRSPMVEGFEIYNFFYLTGNINTGLSGSQVKKETFMLGVVADPVALAKYRL